VSSASDSVFGADGLYVLGVRTDEVTCIEALAALAPRRK
jgi:hypothetical protein